MQAKVGDTIIWFEAADDGPENGPQPPEEHCAEVIAVSDLGYVVFPGDTIRPEWVTDVVHPNPELEREFGSIFGTDLENGLPEPEDDQDPEHPALITSYDERDE